VTKLGIVPRRGDDRIDVDGFSFGFVGDRVGHLGGFQLALGWDEAYAGVRGAQLAVGATYAAGESRGLAIAAGVTASEGAWRGTQIAGLATLARGELRGVQIAGAVALADDVQGLQLAPFNGARQQAGTQLGVVNYAGDGGGLRFGVVNVARKTRGFQFGVVNVAEHDDGESFALINVVGNGIHDVAAYATDGMLTNLTFKLGGRHLFSELGAAYQPGDTIAAGTQQLPRAGARWGTIFGVGWRAPLAAGRLEALEVEAQGMMVYPAWRVMDDAPGLDSLRVTALVRVAPHLDLIAGVAGNVVVGQNGADFDGSYGGLQRVYHDGRTTVRIYPGLLLGLQI